MTDFLFRVPGGKTFKYQFSPETTISIVKKTICELNNYDLLKTKLIHRCSILTDDTKIKDIEITPIEYIIIQPYSSIPTSIDCQLGKLPDLQPPKPLSPSEISEAINNLESIDQPHKGKIKTLLEMGFSLQDSIRGLRSTNYNVEAAAEYLTSDCYDNENANDFRRLDRQKLKEKPFPSFNDSFLPPNLQLGSPQLPPLNSLGLPPGPPNISLGPQAGAPLNSANPPPFGQNPFFNPPPFQSMGPMPPQAQQDLQNPHNQFFGYRILAPEQKRDVDELAREYNHLPIDIIVQFYEANDKNLEKTRNALK